MMKRLVVGLSVSVLSLAVVPAASAAPSETATKLGLAKVTKVTKVKKVKKAVVTDQVKIKTPGGGVSTLRIDWD